ncbi:MAG: hypothetical protein KC944_19150, partial [Candidatus Omnitrophica bacterium]|nr:hypothetical protein [Candidatus Omnitrophota bacterium]
ALFHFPVVRSGDQIDSGTVSIQLTLTSDEAPIDGLAFGTVFFDEENVAGVLLSPTEETPLTYCIENDQIPANARSAAVLKLPIGATEALHQFLNIDRSGDYVDFVFLLNKLLPSDNPLIHAVIHREEPTANGMGLARSSYEAQPFAPTFLDPDNLILSGQELLFPVVLTDGGCDTTLYIQNAERLELGCEILFFEIEKPQEAPLAKGLSLGDPLVDWLGAKSFSTTRPRSVHLESIHPGSTRAIHPRDYVGKGFRGRAVIRSLGSIVGCADIFSGGTLATYSGRRVAVGGQSGSLEAYGPLALSPLAGWETSVYVQNLGRTDDAKVRVTLYGSNGVPTQIQSGFAPARSSVEFRFSPADYQENPETGEGWVLIESEDYHIGDGLFVEAPNVLGVVHLTKRSESGCILEAVAYNTLNRQEAYLEDFIGAINNYAPFPAVFKGYSDDELNTSFSMVNFDPTPHDLISNDLLFRGEDFMTMLSPITLPPRSSRIVSVNDYAGIPSGSKGSLLAPFQVNGTGFLGLGAVGFTRAEALLPHSECVGENETPTQTPTGTITSTPTLSPTETPTGTLTITSSQTPTVTPTATEMGGENEQMRADINRNRKIDHEDLLILLKWYLTEYK